MASGNGVEPAFVIGMAASDSLNGQPAAADRAVLPNRLRGVTRAARLESTGGTEQWRDPALIRDEQRDQQCGDRGAPRLSVFFVPHRPPARRRFAARSRARAASESRLDHISSPDIVAAGRRAMTTTSTPRPISLRLCRNHSRTRRFTRFLVTALPTLRLALIPSRGWPSSASHGEAATSNTNAGALVRVPSFEIR